MTATFENRPTTQTLTRGAAAAMAAQSSSAAAEPRKRKRGALQDISNSTTKKPLEPTDAAAVKKDTVSLTSVRVVPTKTRKQAASSKPPTRANAKGKTTKTTGTKRASVATKKSAESKRRKQDAVDETHAPQKIQTSLLSFQTTKSVARKPKAAVAESEPKVDDESAVNKVRSPVSLLLRRAHGH